MPAVVLANAANLANIAGSEINPATEDGNLASIKTNTDKLDVNLSTVASQATLASIFTELQAKTEPADTQNIAASSLPLPTGASTSALQTTGNTLLSSIDSKVLTDTQLRATPVPVSGPLTNGQLRATPVPISGTVTANVGTIGGIATEITLSSLLTELQLKADLTETQPISAASLPLPTGASTSALQTTGNTTLSSLLTELQLKADLTETQPINVASWIGSTVPTVGQKTSAQSIPVVLPSDQTITASVSSVPEEKTFIISSLVVAIGTNKSMLSLLNAGAGSKIMKLLGIYIRNAQTGAVTGVMADFRLYRMTGHSVGTDLTATIQLYDTNDTLDSNITARTGATIAGEFAQHIDRWFWSSDEFGPGAPDVESGDHPTQTLIKHHDRPPIPGKPLILRPGQGLTLKQITASTAGSFDIAFIFCHST